jgi:hypothetical protein
VKQNAIHQVAKYVIDLFSIRFERAGSLYIPSPAVDGIKVSDYVVGPIISKPFYTLLDSAKPYPNITSGMIGRLQGLRGPFVHTTDYMTSTAYAHLLCGSASHLRSDEVKKFEDEYGSEAEVQLVLAENSLRKLFNCLRAIPVSDSFTSQLQYLESYSLFV